MMNEIYKALKYYNDIKAIRNGRAINRIGWRIAGKASGKIFGKIFN